VTAVDFPNGIKQFMPDKEIVASTSDMILCVQLQEPVRAAPNHDTVLEQLQRSKALE